MGIRSLGFIPGKQICSNIVTAGCVDIPERTGETFHSWGYNHGIEPYVSAGEISFEEKLMMCMELVN